MRKMTLVATICVVAVTTMIIAGWNFGAGEPKAIATAEAAVAADLMSPFELMVRHGKNLPMEAWDAF